MTEPWEQAWDAFMASQTRLYRAMTLIAGTEMRDRSYFKAGYEACAAEGVALTGEERKYLLKVLPFGSAFRAKLESHSLDPDAR